MNTRKNNSGFTLVELAITMTIVILLGYFFVQLARNVTDTGSRFSNSLLAQQTMQSTLQVMVPEIRSAAQSNDGAYPVSIASTSTFEFYSDIDGDGLFDRVRYFLNGNSFYKGVIKPAGSPLSYATSSEVLQDLVDNLVPGTQLFSYYDKNATSSNSTPLPSPIDPLLVKTVKISLTANQGTTSTPSIISVETEATMRNLRYK